MECGTTFQVTDLQGNVHEQIFPFDFVPRILEYAEWKELEKGIKQRNTALNLFLRDIYSDQKICSDKIIPVELIKSSRFFLKEMIGFRVPHNVHIHLSGTDVIRNSNGELCVLEDNIRVPSGISYAIMNRRVMQNNFESSFQDKSVLEVEGFIKDLFKMLQDMSCSYTDDVTAVLLTQGTSTSAYFEHKFLAEEMGIELVEGQDLFVDDNCVFLKTVQGPKRVHVIYRRIGDAYLDPTVYNKKSTFGCKGLMNSYLNGKVTLVNAPGNGIADDKAVYSYVPEIIKYYLNEKPILSNVKTYVCYKEKDLKYVLDNIDKLVVKPVDLHGGKGVTFCDRISKMELKNVRDSILRDPRRYIAQEIIDFSTHMTFIEETGKFEPRNIDLRTFAIISSKESYIMPGGLTRVALERDSLLVNSSQGGGSKDTWVLED